MNKISRDELFKMVVESGFMADESGLHFCDIRDIERFAKLVAAAEREACANLCERRAGTIDNDRKAALISAAMAIRARGEK